jgi:hypothetical protein
LAGISALTYLVWTALLNEFRANAILFAWDLLIAILWVVTSGIFGSMYLTENPEMDQGIQDMKVAAGFDLANMFLWLGSAGYCGWVVFVADRRVLNEGRVKGGVGEESGVGMEERSARRERRAK